MTTKKIVRRSLAPSQPSGPATGRTSGTVQNTSNTPKTSPSPVKAVRRVIPVKAAPAPAPEPTNEDGSPRVDYAAVVKRYCDKVTNRKSAIRAKCIQCCCGVVSEVRECTVKSCPLWPFRMGEDPNNLKVKKRLASETSQEEE